MIDFLCNIPTANLTYNNWFEQEIFANFETEETINKLLSHLRKRVPEINVVNVNDPDWQKQIGRFQVYNYTYGFGLLTESIQPSYFLETKGVNYFGVRPFGIFLSSNKPHASALMQALGYLVPKEKLVLANITKDEAKTFSTFFSESEYLVIKPAYEESSIGLRLIKNNPENIEKAFDEIYKDIKAPLIIQEYINGQDVTVPIIGRSEALIMPGLVLKRQNNHDKPFIFEANAKSSKAGLQYVAIKEFDFKTRVTIYKMALDAFRVTHQRDNARLDLRVTSDGKCYFLEMNANPQLALGKASFSVSAALVDLEMCDVFEMIVNGNYKNDFELLKRGL